MILKATLTRHSSPHTVSGYVVAAVLFTQTIACLQADTAAVSGFGSGGWNADDVRDSSGASISNNTTHAPGSGATLNESAVASQIQWKNTIGSLGNLGGVSLTGTATGSGKSTISVVDSQSGLAAAGTALGENFKATYRWQNTDTVAPGVSFKIGVQSTDWEASQSGYTATRSGEASWDLILVYDPAQPGNSPGNTTTNGAFVTASVDANTSKFFLYAQAGNTYHAEFANGSVAKTLAEWAADPVAGELLFGDGAKIANTQFGFGSGNANASGVLDHATVSYLNDGARIDFVDAASYTGGGSGYGDAANWGGTTPSSTQNLVVGQDATLAVTGTQDTRSLGILAGTTGITLNEGATLVLNQAENGTLSVDSGATLNVTGAGTLQAGVIEAGGTLNLAAVTLLNGGALAHPVRDGGSSAKSRYGLVVLNGGTVNLQNGADVTLENNTGSNGLKAMIRVGEVSGAEGPGVLNIAEGARLKLGSLHGTDSWGALHVGDWGGEGVVNQTGGTVDIYGALMIGNEGGTGTYTITDGAVNIYRPVGDNGAIIIGRATNNRTAEGTLNIDGGVVTLGAEGGMNGNVAMVIGGISDDLAAYANGKGTVNHNAGELYFRDGVLKFGRGNGTYNLNGGILSIGGTNGISATPNGTYAFNFGGGTLQVIDSPFTTSIDANLVAGKSSTINTNGFSATWSGNLTGSGTFNKAGLGTLTLEGDNNLTGEAYVIEGAINQTDGESSIKYLAVGSGSGADGDYNLSAGVLNITQTLQVGDWGGEGVFNQTGGTVNVTGSFNVGNQGGSGEYNLSAGTLNLSGGLYNLGRNTDTKPASTGVFNLSGTGVLDVAGGNFIIGNRDSTATGENGTGVFNQTGGVFRISGTTGADNLFLSGYGDGEYNLLGGVLEIGGDRLRGNYGGGGSYAFNLGGGKIKVIGSDLTTSVVPTLVEGTTSTIDTNGKNAVFANGFAGTGGFAKKGVGALTLNGTTDLQAASTVSGVLKVGAGSGKTGTLNLSDDLTVIITNGVGRLQVGVDGGTGIANFNTGASFSIDESNKTSGYATLDIGRGAGSTGTLNHSAGLVDLAGGALQIGYSGATGTYNLTNDAELLLGASSSIFIGSGAGASGLLTIADDAVFSTDGQVFVGAGTGATGTITQTGGTASFTGTIVSFGTDSDETSNAPGTGIYNLEAGALTFEDVAQGVRFGTHENGGSGVLNQSGGTVTFTNTTLTVGAHGAYNQSGGVIKVGGNNLKGSGAYNLGGGTIKVTGTALTTGLNATLTAGKTLTINTNNLGATFSGSFTGAGGLAKTGLGTLRFTGNSGYTGATSIENGVFQVDGILANTVITIGNGATLSGHGTVADVYIENGGNLILGDTPGLFTITGDLNLAEESYTLLKIAGLASYDQLKVEGTLFAGGILDVQFSGGFDAFEGYSFDLFDGSFADETTFAEVWLPVLDGGLEWDLGDLYSSGQISVIASAVPEPAAWAALAGLFALATATIKRRRRA
jgi:fibronectin-binding autotransporter adhesin